MGKIVYAMKTSSGTFIANNMNHHNCNVTLHGNLKKYREHLIREIGEDRVNALDRKKSQKISTPELGELLKEVKAKYRELLKQKKA